MLSKKDIVEANRQFSTGKVVNESSLDFAVYTNSRSRNWLRSSAVLTRAILIDHVFEDGNKRTAAAVIMSLMELNKVPFDPELVAEGVIKILMRNITSIREIERCIKDAVR